jgi:hypothetical protein
MTGSSIHMEQDMSIENKGVRSLANAQASVENETQQHDYSEDASGSKPLQGEFERKGENDQRVAKASKVTGGRHVTSKDGLAIAKERSRHVEANRKASAASFDSDKLTVCPEQKKRK